MSCPNATAPIDIGKDNIAGKCDLKCEFSFHYNNSSCIATNRGDYISLAYDQSSSPPVTYNSASYDVKEVRIYSPSLHSFNGTKADGEFIIIHHSSSGSKPLLVCIPIKSSNTSEENSKILTTIIQTVSSNAPADSEKTTVSLSRFNLNAFVPRKPFFSYTASEPYQPCSTDTVEYIVYPSDSAIGLASNVFRALQKVIAANSYDIKPSPGLFFNPKGPTSGAGTGEIYIDCQPVGESDEEKIIVTDSGSAAGTMTMDDLMHNKYFQMFLGCLVFLIIIFVVKLVVGSINPNKSAAGSVMGNIIGIVSKPA